MVITVIKKCLLNKKGSALIYSILILFILSVLGTLLISITMSNLQINRITGEMNTAYYLSDGAIEEALSEIREHTYNAEKTAQEWINEPSQYKATGEWNDFILYLEDGITNGILTGDDARLLMEDKLEEEFRKKYFDYFIEGGDSIKDSIKTELETVDFTASFNDQKNPVIKPIEISSQFVFEDENSRIEVNLLSSGEYNEYEKRISLDLDIILPKYEYIVVSSTEKREIYSNEIIERAFSAEGDLIVTGGDVEINGDVYTYGTYPSLESIPNKLMGGIVTGYTSSDTDFLDYNQGFSGRNLEALGIEGSGSLTINGNLATRSAVHILSDNSIINIRDNTFCDTLAIEENGDASQIDIGNNLYMYGDLEINGDDGQIFIGNTSLPSTGKIYGLLDGDPAGIYTDRSSSIIINADNGNEKLIANNIYIAGTSYIQVYKYDPEAEINRYYQTGESVNLSKYGYVYLYSSRLPSEDYTYPVIYTSDDGTEYEMIEADEGLFSDVRFKIDHFLRYFYDSFHGPEMSLQDKNKVSINNLDSSDLNDNYSLGAIVEDGLIYNPDIEDSEDNRLMNYEEFINLRQGLIKEIDKNTNIFYTRDYYNNTNTNPIFSDFIDESIEVNNNIDDLDNFIFINMNEDKDLFINSPEGIDLEDVSNDYEYIEADNMMGVILSRGNIFIYQDENESFTFNGSIITKGNIVLYGPGAKTINHDYDKVIDLLIRNENLGNLFHISTGKESYIESGSTLNNNLNMKVRNSTKEPISVTLVSTPDAIGANKKQQLKTFNIKSWREVDY